MVVEREGGREVGREGEEIGRRRKKRGFLLNLLAVVDFPIVVLDELFYKALIFVKDLFAHVGDVVEHGLILNQEILLEGGKEGE